MNGPSLETQRTHRSTVNWKLPPYHADAIEVGLGSASSGLLVSTTACSSGSGDMRRRFGAKFGSSANADYPGRIAMANMRTISPNRTGGSARDSFLKYIYNKEVWPKAGFSEYYCSTKIATIRASGRDL
jgi:hypothetical protein